MPENNPGATTPPVSDAAGVVDSPSSVHQRPTGRHGANWRAQAERGNHFWLTIMRWLSLSLGRPISRLILHPIAAYFLLFSPSARRASADYLARALGRPARWREIYRHFHSFATTIHDRVYFLCNRFELFELAIEGEDEMRALAAHSGGCFLLGAHLGSFEVLRAYGRSHPGLRIAILMLEDQARRLSATLNAINPAAGADIIPLGKLDSMLRARAALDDGAFLGMLGDRTPGGEITRPREFLGAPADFPLGPLRLAAMMGRPVVFMSGLYHGGNRYTLRFENLADFSGLTRETREEAIDNALSAYAQRLEATCKKAPYNWFNFFDFWKKHA